MDLDDGGRREFGDLHTLFFLRAKSLGRGLRSHVWLTLPALATCVYSLSLASSTATDPCVDRGDFVDMGTVSLAIAAWLALQCGTAVYLCRPGGGIRWLELGAFGASVFIIVAGFTGVGSPVGQDSVRVFKGESVRGIGQLESWGGLALLWGWCIKLIYHLHALSGFP